MRARYQHGCLYLDKRKLGPAVWCFRFRLGGKHKKTIIGSVEQFPTRSAASKAADAWRLTANPDLPARRAVTLGAVIARYIAEELPERSVTTRTYYLPWIRNHILPRWGEYVVSAIKTLAVEDWLKSLDLSHKSKRHIQNQMALLFDCAMRWELASLAVNPMRMVRVRGGRQSRRRARYHLSPEQVALVLANLPEPWRTMAIVAVCTGLRRSEIAGLQWADFGWEEGTLAVGRGYSLGAINEKCKSKASQAKLPLHPALLAVLRAHHGRSLIVSPWVFVNVDTGKPLSLNNGQEQFLAPAGIAAGVGPGLGWHSFRHTYSTLLRHFGVDIKVQQELMRHANVETTLNIYTKAPSERLRAAHNDVVKMVLA